MSMTRTPGSWLGRAATQHGPLTGGQHWRAPALQIHPWGDTALTRLPAAGPGCPISCLATRAAGLMPLAAAGIGLLARVEQRQRDHLRRRGLGLGRLLSPGIGRPGGVFAAVSGQGAAPG